MRVYTCYSPALVCCTERRTTVRRRLDNLKPKLRVGPDQNLLSELPDTEKENVQFNIQ